MQLHRLTQTQEDELRGFINERREVRVFSAGTVFSREVHKYNGPTLFPWEVLCDVYGAADIASHRELLEPQLGLVRYAVREGYSVTVTTSGTAFYSPAHGDMVEAPSVGDMVAKAVRDYYNLLAMDD